MTMFKLTRYIPPEMKKLGQTFAKFRIKKDKIVIHWQSAVVGNEAELLHFQVMK